MSSHASRRVVVSLLLVVVMAVPAFARGKKSSSTEPGTYKEWGPNIDQIEIIRKFHTADYKNIVVEPFKTSDVKMPEKEDNSYQPVVNVLTSATETFVSGLKSETERSVSISEKEKEPKFPDTLIIRGKVVEINPGSRAARYLAGFGAGAAGAKIEGEVVDAKTGEVLAKFTQERRSGTGAAGGGYEDLLNRDMKTIGGDIGRMLKEF
jgi:Domain of unknown function (DUF4410)